MNCMQNEIFDVLSLFWNRTSLDWLALRLKFGSVYIYQLGGISISYF